MLAPLSPSRPVGRASARRCGWRQAGAAAGLLACAVAALAAPVAAPASGTAAAATGAAAAKSPAGSFYANFDGLQLTDQDGRRFNAAQLKGQFALVNFVYTGCSTTCPLQTQALAQLPGQLAPALRDRLRLLSVSLDPLSDSPPVLKAFAKRMGADQPRWRFVTGRPADTERLSDALRLFRPGPDVRKPDEHSTAVWLIDPQGQLRMRYSGNPPDLPRLVRELTALDGMLKRAPAP